METCYHTTGMEPHQECYHTTWEQDRTQWKRKSRSVLFEAQFVFEL